MAKKDKKTFWEITGDGKQKISEKEYDLVVDTLASNATSVAIVRSEDKTSIAITAPIGVMKKEDAETFVEGIMPEIETIAAKLDQAAAAREQLTSLKEQLDQVNTFVTGLKDYTDGVAQASDGAATLSSGAMLVSTGASTLQETGTKTLKDSILTAEKSAAEKLLPLVEKNLDGALKVWNVTKDHLSDIGYDLRPEGMAAETVYIIRTDLK